MYPFPPDRVEPLGPYAVYSLVAISVTAFLWAVVRAFRRGLKSARWSDIPVWSVATFVPVFLLRHATIATTAWYEQTPRLAEFVGWCALAGLAGGLVTAGRILHQRRHETLLNLYVVAIVCVAVPVLLLPTVSTPREVPRRTQCRNNLKLIGLALHNYHDAFNVFPAAADRGPELPALSWRISLLPFLDASPMYLGYRLDEPWDSPANRPIAKACLAAYQCPSRRTPAQNSSGEYYTDYAILTGPGTVFPDEGGRRFSDIKDGASNTILVVEASGTEIVWTEPRDIPAASVRWRPNAPGDKPGKSNGLTSSFHRAGAHVLLADGSVRFVSEFTDEAVFRALATADGGDTPGDSW